MTKARSNPTMRYPPTVRPSTWIEFDAPLDHNFQKLICCGNALLVRVSAAINDNE